jgi:hypothetical protein
VTFDQFQDMVLFYDARPNFRALFQLFISGAYYDLPFGSQDALDALDFVGMLPACLEFYFIYLLILFIYSLFYFIYFILFILFYLFYFIHLCTNLFGNLIPVIYDYHYFLFLCCVFFSDSVGYTNHSIFRKSGNLNSIVSTHWLNIANEMKVYHYYSYDACLVSFFSYLNSLFLCLFLSLVLCF